MKIVHINTYDIEGGAARMALGLAKHQRLDNHDAHMIVGRKSLKNDISSRFNPLPNETIRPFCESAKLSYFHFQGSHKLSSHPEITKADILHVHNIHFDYFNPFSLSFLSHIKPTIWTFHDLFPVTGFCMHPGDCTSWSQGCFPCFRQQLNDPHNPNQLLSMRDSTSNNLCSPGPALCVQLKKILYDHCNITFICPSDWIRKQVAKSCFSTMHIHVVHNGIDTSLFKPMDKIEAKLALGLSPETTVLGAVAVHGALDNPLKGGTHLKQLIEHIIHKHSNIVFLNVGSDKKNTSPFIRNIPYMENQQELALIYSAMDVMVHAAAAESFCLVAVEAMACGIPVVAFNNGALPELIVHDETGLLCDGDDTMDLINTVSALIDKPYQRQNLGKAGRERSLALFDFSKTHEKYIRLYLDEIEDRQKYPRPVKSFNLANIPAFIRTPEFIKAEELKTGIKVEKQETWIGNKPIDAFLDQLSPALYKQFEPFHTKAEKVKQIFSLRNAGKLEESLDILNDLIPKWPKDMTLMRTKGVTLGLMGRDEEAIKSLKKCLKAEKPLQDVWLNIADIYLRKNDIKACRYALETFAGIDPNLKGFNHRMGLLCMAEQNFSEAVTYFKIELQLHGAEESLVMLQRIKDTHM
ncbi:hypothetical protein MTBBW1_2640004 [Desulfamplus magnetovallimortis]|uniref:Uncharacterized protein n=1 Tax=Desulfamplus magnetovallimortis TaxID=1246637 RepID=A0A1W1HEX9_9BACT|nr:glycosyltransferase [Desulfamplus magnetovallimortis]SLM31061.1 hypothetical protein MTBBW1_2640004 [Desulfamplus magnetovallimortis]